MQTSFLVTPDSPLRRPSSPSTAASPPSDIDSFNLKSFRHISSSPRTSSPNASSTSLVPPAIPRPRGLSTASDASPRISVGAFREAQRRSTAGSPVPSNRAPSPLPSGILRSSHKPLRNSRSYASGSDDHSFEDEDSDDHRSGYARQGAEAVRLNALLLNIQMMKRVELSAAGQLNPKSVMDLHALYPQPGKVPTRLAPHPVLPPYPDLLCCTTTTETQVLWPFLLAHSLA